jgi:hypothetical protein
MSLFKGKCLYSKRFTMYAAPNVIANGSAWDYSNAEHSLIAAVHWLTGRRRAVQSTVFGPQVDDGGGLIEQ